MAREPFLAGNPMRDKKNASLGLGQMLAVFEAYFNWNFDCIFDLLDHSGQGLVDFFVKS